MKIEKADKMIDKELDKIGVWRYVLGIMAGILSLYYILKFF